MDSGSKTATQRAWNLVVTLALLASVMLIGAGDLKAQANSWPPAFHGSWDIMGNDFNQSEALWASYEYSGQPRDPGARFRTMT